MIKLRWGHYSGLYSSMTGVLIKGGNLDTETETQQEPHVKTVAKLPQAKASQRLLKTHQKQEERLRADSSTQL